MRQPSRTDGLRGWPYIGLRQEQGERAAFARGASQLNLSTQQAGQFTADCETKAGAAVLAARAGIRLLESLEDDSLLI
jgi:hypothetical protein